MAKIINLGPNTRRGFLSNMYTTFSTVYACYLNNEEFYIDWSDAIDYRAIECVNPFDFCFKQPYFEVKPKDCEISIEYGLPYGTDVNDADREKWNEVLTKFLILKDDIKGEIDKYYNDNFAGKKILCVHKRGSDHGYHEPIKPNSEYFKVIDYEMALHEYDKIFLATDEVMSAIEFKHRYGDKLLCLDIIRTTNETPIFHQGINKFQHTKELLMDVYLLSMGNKMIKSNSSLSIMACYINKDIEYINM